MMWHSRVFLLNFKKTTPPADSRSLGILVFAVLANGPGSPIRNRRVLRVRRFPTEAESTSCRLFCIKTKQATVRRLFKNKQRTGVFSKGNSSRQNRQFKKISESFRLLRAILISYVLRWSVPAGASNHLLGTLLLELSF
jgi:hypothetical protein